MSLMAVGTVGRLSQLTFDSTSHLTQQVGTKMAVGTVCTSSQMFGSRHFFLPRARARMRARLLSHFSHACTHERERENEKARTRERKREGVSERERE